LFQQQGLWVKLGSMKGNVGLSRFLTREQLAGEIGVSTKTLDNWRVINKGPQFRKFGAGRKAAVRYERADIEAWLASQPRGGDPLRSDQADKRGPRR
jgi:predicted DNA-binding transcriptional regulator AlpA